ncbi:cytochrome P450 [Delitschia confertaspora ATCC 74209]|uniref:Cytochrome P450 n=1 Tax=Delitschia confertaspora ATCC 74209 TaxID=1513339 RepID=A0A9P4JND4_9PLEO|nr:cytochrome P450 [Delitschia confertaspora ATCC 74209]
MPHLLLITIILLVTICYLSRKHRIISPKSGKELPTCPYRWPDGQGDVGKFLDGESNGKEWTTQHGRIYRIWSGMTPEIVLSRPEDVQNVFKDSDAHSKAVNSNAGWLFGQLLGKCVGLVSGLDWHRVRASMGNEWTYKDTANYLPRISDLTREYFHELHSKGRLDQGLLNPVSDLRMLPFWIVADRIYGTLTPQLRSELESLVPLRESLFLRVLQGGVSRYPWSQYLPTKTNSDLKEFKSRWARFNDKVHKACKLANKAVPITHMYDCVQKNSMDAENLYQTLDEMLFANLDVTIGGISWNLIFLAANPTVQDDLREELRQIRRTSDKTKTWEGYLLNTKTLLAACILEAARLKPLAPFSIPQAAPTSRTVSGFLVPPNANYIVDTYALNIRNPYWGKDRAAYRPSRFLDSKTSDIRYQYWRFGFGPRQCLGKYLAELMCRSLIAHLVENYELGLQGTNTWNRKPETWITQPNTDIRCELRGRG